MKIYYVYVLMHVHILQGKSSHKSLSRQKYVTFLTQGDIVILQPIYQRDHVTYFQTWGMILVRDMT